MLNLTINELQAVNIASSHQETRYYLCGVLFEKYENALRLVATDGHRIHIITKGEVSESDSPVANVIISNNDIKKLVTLYKMEVKTNKAWRKETHDLVIDTDGTKFKASVVDKEGVVIASIDAKGIDGSFPDYNRCIPSLQFQADNGLPYECFNASYIGDFGTAASLLGDNTRQVIIINGDKSPAQVRLNRYDAFLGVLMPYAHHFELPAKTEAEKAA